MKVAALTRKQTPTPTDAIITPARAGPTARAAFSITLLRLTAFCSSSSPTSSEANDCWAGAVNARARPSAAARTKTIQSVTEPVTVSIPRARARRPEQMLLTTSRRRLSRRSATTPA